MPNLKKCVITGADDDSAPEDLLALSRDFPFVEWGFLLGKGDAGKPRYPTHAWFDRLLAVRRQEEERAGKVHISVHICDDWAKNLAHKGDLAFFDEFGTVLDQCDVIQLNFSRQIIDKSLKVDRLFAALKQHPQRTFVFQLPTYDDSSLELVRAARQQGIAALPFFDPSIGRGIHPDRWPCPVHDSGAPPSKKDMRMLPMFGFAGGMGPENISRNLEQISSFAEEHTRCGSMQQGFSFWIDMETKVRTDKKLDCGKVRQVLEVCKDYVSGDPMVGLPTSRL